MPKNMRSFQGFKRLIPDSNKGVYYEVKPLIEMTEVSEDESSEGEPPDSASSTEGREIAKCPITDFTDLIDGCGVWQIWVLVVTGIAGIPVPWNHLAISFFASPQDYWCARPPEFNFSLEDWLRNAMPNQTVEGVTNHSQCTMYDIYTNASVLKIIPCTEWEFSPDFQTITKEWNLVCSREWMSSMSQSIYMGGFFSAVLIFGQLSDMYGRHLIIMVNVVVLLTAGFLAAFATTYTMFAVSRFFVGMGQSGLSLTTFVLMIEIVGANRRSMFSVLQGFGWNVGYVLLPWIAWHLPSWHHLQIAITLPCITFILFYWILPESPRWLLAKGDFDKAVQVLTSASKWNGKHVPDMKAQVKRLYHLAGKAENIGDKVTIIDLLRTTNLRKRTIALFGIWFITSFVYYSLSLTTGQLGGDYYLNFLLSALVEIPASFLCLFVLQRFGRKIPFILTYVGSGVACFAVVLIPATMHWYLVSSAMVGKSLVSASFIILYIYSAEIFPTVARNVGLGMSSMVARIGSITAPFMKDLGKMTSPSVPMAMCGMLSLLSALFILLLPETKGYQIPETLQQAETFGKKDDEKGTESH